MEVLTAQSALSLVEMPSKSSPLPTDSMITVRLSDAQIRPLPDESVRTSKRRSSSVNSQSSSASARSSTRSSTPSNTTVDWEELEKTEEQEPRDQATDEVCSKNSQTTLYSLMKTVYNSPSSSPGARKRCIGRKSQIWPCYYCPASRRNSPSIYPTFEEAGQRSSTTEPSVLPPSCAADDRA